MCNQHEPPWASGLGANHHPPGFASPLRTTPSADPRAALSAATVPWRSMTTWTITVSRPVIGVTGRKTGRRWLAKLRAAGNPAAGRRKAADGGMLARSPPATARTALKPACRRPQRRVRREIAGNRVVEARRRLRKRSTALVETRRRLRKRFAALVETCRRLRKRFAALVEARRRLRKRFAALAESCRRLRQLSTTSALRGLRAPGPVAGNDHRDVPREKRRSTGSRRGKRTIRASDLGSLRRWGRLLPCL